MSAFVRVGWIVVAIIVAFILFKLIFGGDVSTNAGRGPEYTPDAPAIMVETSGARTEGGILSDIVNWFTDLLAAPPETPRSTDPFPE